MEGPHRRTTQLATRSRRPAPWHVARYVSTPRHAVGLPVRDAGHSRSGLPPSLSARDAVAGGVFYLPRAGERWAPCPRIERSDTRSLVSRVDTSSPQSSHPGLETQEGRARRKAAGPSVWPTLDSARPATMTSPAEALTLGGPGEIGALAGATTGWGHRLLHDDPDLRGGLDRADRAVEPGDAVTPNEGERRQLGRAPHESPR